MPESTVNDALDAKYEKMIAGSNIQKFLRMRTKAAKLGVLGTFTEWNVQFGHDEGFTSIGLWADTGTSLDAARLPMPVSKRCA